MTTRVRSSVYRDLSLKKNKLGIVEENDCMLSGVRLVDNFNPSSKCFVITSSVVFFLFCFFCCFVLFTSKLKLCTNMLLNSIVIFWQTNNRILNLEASCVTGIAR